MKKVSLSGSIRENVGKKDAKNLRLQGLVPCVLYGNTENISFYVNEIKLNKIIFNHEVFIVELEINEKIFPTIVREIQLHPVTDKILHIDFLELIDSKKVKVDVPLNIVGNSPGVKRGGILIQLKRKIKVFSFPADLPDSVEVDISKLNVGDKFRIKDLDQSKNTYIGIPQDLLVAVRRSRTMSATSDDMDEDEEAVTE